MKLFKMNRNSTSYKYPSVKIILSVFIISLFVSLKEICTLFNFDLSTFEQNNPTSSVIISLISGILGIAAILCIYIAVGEMLFVLENKNYTSYLIPALTMAAFSVIIVCLFLVNNFLKLDRRITVIVHFCFLVIGGLCAIGIFICIMALLTVPDNRSQKEQKNNIVKQKDCILKTIDGLIDIIEKNDIIEIIILLERCVKIGASSNCKQDSYVFYDKRYYINEEEFNTIKAFSDRLKSLCANAEVYVYSIDGIPLRNQK